MKRPSRARPSDQDFEEHVEKATHESAEAAIGWFIAESRRARAQEGELIKQLRVLRGGRHL